MRDGALPVGAVRVQCGRDARMPACCPRAGNRCRRSVADTGAILDVRLPADSFQSLHVPQQ
eukprot:2382201-Alexandrium_andersonii.AAC.1